MLTNFYDKAHATTSFTVTVYLENIQFGKQHLQNNNGQGIMVLLNSN